MTAIRAISSIAGRVPPHDLEAEAAVLSAVILHRDRLDVVAGIVRPEHFYSEANARIYETALELATTGKAVDVVQIASLLRDRERLSAVGGVAYLAQIVDATPASHHVEDHAKTVLRKARRRAVIRTAHELVAEGYGDVGDEEEWIGGAEQRLATIAQDSTVRESTSLGLALRRVWQSIHDQIENPNKAPGVPTGLRDLDALVRLWPSRCTTVGGFWGDGKSALGLQIALAAAAEKRRSNDLTAPPDEDDRSLWPTAVLIVSVEMEADELAQRALFSSARVDGSKVHRKQHITEVEWRALQETGSALTEMAIWIDDTPDMTTQQLRATVRKHRAMAERMRFELRLVVVDYLQLLNGKDGARESNREQEVSRVARAIKLVSRENKTHVLALAQLNDDANKGKEARKPSSRDFRESKAIAMHSDNVILIFNPHARERALAYRERGSMATPGAEVCELILDKHRGGRTGTTRVVFHPSCTLFADHDGRDDR